VGTGCFIEERAECDVVWEQVPGEGKGHIVTVLGNRLQ